MRLRSIAFILAAFVSLSAMLTIAEVVAAEGKAKSRMIVATGKERQRRIGTFYYLRKHPGGAYAAVVRAFGTPTSQRDDGANDCILRWKPLGLEISLGVGSSSPCSNASLKRDYWYGTKIASRIWRTNRGLRIGDSLGHLKSIYPEATFRSGPRYWSLATVKKWGGLVFDLLEAKVKAGRVSAIVLPTGFLG